MPNNHTKYRTAKLLELELCERYSREWGEPCFIAVGKFSDYDFCSQSRKYSVEVKCESSPVRTGNICIEYWNSSLNEPSGILCTKSTLWLHCIKEADHLSCLEFETNVMRKITVELGMVKHNSNAIFKCIPLERVRPLAQRIFTIKSEPLVELIADLKEKDNG